MDDTRVSLRVANGHVRIPLAEYQKLADWQQAWIERARQTDWLLLASLRLLAWHREEDAGNTIRFLNDENNHLWEVVAQAMGDVEALRTGLRGVLAARTLEDAQAVAREVLEESELVLVEE
jgi:hypothetical protein